MRRVVTILGAAVALAGCGGGKAAPVPPRLPDATVQLADCNQWHELRPVSRARLVEGMRGFFGASVDGVGHGYGETLTDEQAGHLIDNACQPRWAARFKLYKIYGRAAAFTPEH